MGRLFRFLEGPGVLILVLAHSAVGQQPVDMGRLRPPAARTVALAPAQVHRFSVVADSGRLLRVVVQKRGVDLTLAVLDPQARVAASSDLGSGPYGVESTAASTGESGTYVIQVTAKSGLTLRGNYRISVEPLRPPSDRDQAELRAHQVLRDALAHEKTGDAESLRTAVEAYAGAAGAFERLNEGLLQGLALNRLGVVYDGLHDAAKALETYNKALAVRRTAHDRAGEAATLNNIGLVYLTQDDKTQALKFLGQALAIRHAMHDATGQAGSLFNMARASAGRQALQYFEQALALYRTTGDGLRQAATLRGLGNTTYDLGDKRKAVDWYNQALTAYRAAQDRRGEAMMLNFMATTSFELGDGRKSLEYHEASLPLFHALGDRPNESSTLDSIGSIYNQVLGDKPKALEYYNRALEIQKADADRQGESDTLNSIGTVYSSLGETAKALNYLEPALRIRRELGNRAGEAQTLGNIGTVHTFRGEKRKALEFYGQALTMHRALGSHASAIKALNNMATAYADLGEQPKALEQFEEALKIERSEGDRMAEATTLCNIGALYSGLGETQKAVDNCTQALTIDRAIGARADEAHVLSVIGRIYNDQGEYRKALEFYNQALPLDRAVADRGEEAGTLHNIGRTYFVLGDKARALELYRESLAIFGAIQDRWNEARMLSNLGNLYADLKDTAKALDCYERARAMFRTSDDRTGEAGALDSLGEVYGEQGERRKSLEFYERALSLWRAVGDRDGEAGTLNNLGEVYDSLGEKSRAQAMYQQALGILRTVGDREGEAKVLANLRGLFAASQPDLAIFFGKQSVNVLQSVRRANRELDDALRRSYEKSIESYYRDLAGLLVDRRRFAEAEEVLGLLKDKEAGAYLQRDSVAGELRAATLLDSEKVALARYEQLVGQVALLGQKKAALISKSESQPLSAAERAESDQLDTDLGAVNVVLQRFFDEEEKSLASESGAARRIGEFREAESIQGRLAELGPDVVAIYTLVTPEKYIAMLVTPGARKAYTTSIKEPELNTKIFEFRQKLQNPASDPLPLARELYGIVFPEGLRQDLESIEARTIMWSMDGALRYIPIAALHDDHDYLVARFRNSLITPASMDNLKEVPQAHWRGLGFGVSLAQSGFSALPSVPGELHSIFQQGNDAAPLAGSVRLDGEFTRESFLNDLRQPNHRVVHIATHFDSRPLAANSQMLMGDGHPWRLQEIRAVPRLFSGVDLLTLSACSTAFTNRSEDGREVDSFGTIAQQLGARSVIASLWSVSDEATAVLMQTMYRLREQNPAMGKSEALREAQSRLASGALRPGGSADGADRGVTKAHPAADAPAHDWRHPYFWAPFILIGNWK